MAKEICISSTPHETRLAILEDDQLSEIYYERENEYTLAGSIYNGRVTRVLPGMQSAFVDLGLERDAFLYVTDFLEMEDPEDSDEVEKASISAPARPREVRSGEARSGEARTGEGRSGQQRRPEAASVPAVEIESPVAEPAEPSNAADAASSEDEEAGGARRWRGRRRRRGGRGQALPVADPVETESTSETFLDANLGEPSEDAPHHSHQIHASAGEQTAAAPVELPGKSRNAARSARSESRPEREAASFVLPGESLSKYGGETAPVSKAEKPAAPARSASTAKPASLIESPIEWDGTGLMPGESLARHRSRQPEPSAPIEAEPQGVFADAHSDSHESEQAADLAFVEHKLEEATLEDDLHLHDDEQVEALHSAALEAFGHTHEERILDEFTGEAHAPIVEDEEFSPEHVDEPAEPEATESHSEQASAEPKFEFEFEEEEQEIAPHEVKSEENRSASHHVDPTTPSEFRLFGLGGKKKKDETHEAEPVPAAVATPRPTTVASVSAFAPGNGLIEEEMVDGEESAASHHLHRHTEQDLDEYEETEQLSAHSGELAAAFKEARAGHSLDEEEISTVADLDEEEDEASEETAAAPATRDRSSSGRERGGRGRRNDRGGRTGQATGGQNNRRGGGMSRRTAQTSDLPIISDLLKPGQEILVQIAKEPIAKKGARITSHIALPGRFLVFMPTVSHVGVSRKIESDEERQRLKRILIHERGEASGGFIVRTAAEGTSEDELRSDLRFLIHLWDEIKQRSESSKSPALIYHDLSLIERILRDQISDDFSSIWVDNEAAYERIVRFLNRFSPTLVRRVKLYTKEVPLFEHFGVEDEISKALRSKVWLKSGGSIVINQTEALVAIDINTGKYVGKTARLEDTIVKTNLDAIPEIVRQIRLRDLGGIIIIDFIDMDERKNRFRVMAALEEALKTDRAPTKVLQFNDFGLVAITRKRVKQSLERTLSVPCPTCQATGMVKSSATVANEIYIELRKMRKHFEGADVMLRVHPETVKVLKANNAGWLTEYEDLVGKNILVKSDVSLHPEQFDIQG
ncbi:Rne/Rng family ribonuclease [Terracidiphilus gabretensis]|uniref:Rne/Rng family ribonuclease n=1 Tax=Terracidiphilus gabretensis TaxID=1577687 RepID=UPI00071B9F95|nr:Rne/Rng family ribonuclease [Terracidiphilus gabretensis]